MKTKIIHKILFSIALSTAVLGAGNNGGGNSAAGSAAAQPNPGTGAFNSGQTIDESSVIVQLISEPLSTYPGDEAAAGQEN